MFAGALSLQATVLERTTATVLRHKPTNKRLAYGILAAILVAATTLTVVSASLDIYCYFAASVVSLATILPAHYANLRVNVHLYNDGGGQSAFYSLSERFRLADNIKKGQVILRIVALILIYEFLKILPILIFCSHFSRGVDSLANTLFDALKIVFGFIGPYLIIKMCPKMTEEFRKRFYGKKIRNVNIMSISNSVREALKLKNVSGQEIVTSMNQNLYFNNLHRVWEIEHPTH
ncbi:unnamed protein product [Caenorhabditis bovis]|uniref:Uncharacterized protein n=1 Tax=Caenorhabditis bovis TaxID=2654633 RepID=A0A8S1EDN7_9PELO|nr:unnamed protein product [Caenorhabditis bovis]